MPPNYPGWDDMDPDQFPPAMGEQIRDAQAGQDRTIKRLDRAEQRLQINCIEWADHAYFPDDLSRLYRWLLPPTKIGDYLHHTPNGGARSAAEGGIFKAMGVRAGYPDLSLDICMIEGEQIFAGFRCELKIAEAKLRPNQLLWKEKLCRAGYYFCEARSLDQFTGLLFEYLSVGKPLHHGVWP